MILDDAPRYTQPLEAAMVLSDRDTGVVLAYVDAKATVLPGDSITIEWHYPEEGLPYEQS